MSIMVINPYAFGVTPTDPNFANVVYLASMEGANLDSSYTDTKGHVLTLAGTPNSFISNAQAEYGSTSMKSHNTSGGTMPDSADWNISTANSDQFTLEYSYYQTDTAGNYEVWSQIPASGNYAILSRHNGANWVFFWTSDGTNFQTLTATSGITTANAWVKYAIEKNSSGKLRLYKAGTMLASSTPANSVFFNSTGSVILNQAAAGQDAWLDNVRLTKGLARYDSDSGYTPATAAFPTS